MDVASLRSYSISPRNALTTQPAATLASDASRAALRAGDVIADGPNAGWIYCGTLANEPFLVAPTDSGVMPWREAMNLAAEDNSALPTKAQLNAMYKARDCGALKGTFNLTGSFHYGSSYWSAVAFDDVQAWCQVFGGGYQLLGNIHNKSSVRCVRKYSII